MLSAEILRCFFHHKEIPFLRSFFPKTVVEIRGEDHCQAGLVAFPAGFKIKYGFCLTSEITLSDRSEYRAFRCFKGDCGRVQLQRTLSSFIGPLAGLRRKSIPVPISCLKNPPASFFPPPAPPIKGLHKLGRLSCCFPPQANLPPRLPGSGRFPVPNGSLSAWKSGLPDEPATSFPDDPETDPRARNTAPACWHHAGWSIQDYRGSSHKSRPRCGFSQR